MKIEQLVEKKLREKAPAASTEQPEKEVKNKNRGKWYVINYAKALLRSGISGEARILADYIISNQGEEWKFLPYIVTEQTGLSDKKYYECLNELESVKAIHPRIKNRIGKQYEAGVKLIWNYDYQSWEPKAKKAKKTKTKNNPKNGLSQNGNVQNGNSQNGLSQNGNVQNGNSQNGLSQNGGSINIDKYITSPPGNSEHGSKEAISLNSEHEEKREGAAAKPQPAPPPGTASKGSSFPETAQGQQNGNKYQIPLTVPEVMEQGPRDLWGEPERVPEKPKKKPKGKSKEKPKAAEEIEIPEVEEIKIYIAGYIQENYEKGVHSYIWTDWELAETAGDIQRAIPKYKWKDWKQGARNWIRNNRDGAFKPKMRDPARDTRNQPGRARGQVTTAARIMEMAGNTDPQRALEQRREQEIQKGGVIIQN